MDTLKPVMIVGISAVVTGYQCVLNKKYTMSGAHSSFPAFQFGVDGCWWFSIIGFPAFLIYQGVVGYTTDQMLFGMLLGLTEGLYMVFFAISFKIGPGGPVNAIISCFSVVHTILSIVF